MKAYTKGPWEIKNAHVNSRLICHSEGRYICEVVEFAGDEKTLIANARLIASAPELLEALEKVIELAWRDHRSEDELELLEATDELIGKIKLGVV